MKPKTLIRALALHVLSRDNTKIRSNRGNEARFRHRKFRPFSQPTSCPHHQADYRTGFISGLDLRQMLGFIYGMEVKCYETCNVMWPLMYPGTNMLQLVQGMLITWRMPKITEFNSYANALYQVTYCSSIEIT